MSGRPIPKLSRREVLKSGSIATLGGLLGCRGTGREISGAIVGASRRGHEIRTRLAMSPTETAESEILIVGGGIAGLSAAWWLSRQGRNDYTLLELSSNIGGNAQSGVNAVSAYPWGAHYLPIPNAESDLVGLLLSDLGVIRGVTERGEPLYDEQHLILAPQERLFVYNRWQEGLFPECIARPSDREQYRAFLEAMEAFRWAVGRDGKHAFAIPVALSSSDPKFRSLDRQTMREFLLARGWDSPLLHWYVNYCCRDDYGTPADTVSAWAGVHYFAGRRPSMAPSTGYDTLTWPAGNGWIVEQIRKRLGGTLLTDAVVRQIANERDRVVVDFVQGDTCRRLRARSVIYAAPRFTAPYLLDGSLQPGAGSAPTYAPWMVANLTIEHPPRGDERGTTWDNVLYEGRSLGYVVATQQELRPVSPRSVWTYYRPLDDASPSEARTLALARSWESWRDEVLSELKRPHPDIRDLVSHLDVWLWGHAMVRPLPGTFGASSGLPTSVGRVHFANSDMSGISIFEEAQYQGVSAALRVLQSL